MAQFTRNFSLQSHNTFRMNVSASKYVAVYSDDDLISFVKTREQMSSIKLILGGGSNLLLTGNIRGTVLHILNKGISVLRETKDNVFVQVSAGEDWDGFVQYAVSNGWGGIENLSLIPGTVGASPVQNIGAYGCEVKDTIYSVRYFSLPARKFCTLANKDCQFSYRDSIFKHRLKGKVVITHVIFRLSKKPRLNIGYGSVAEELKAFPEMSLDAVRNAIIAIRRRKLPDPAEVPNSGSFFKNPVISSSLFKKLQKAYPSIPHFISDDKKIKIPAAWLIEQCGWKGYRKGDAGVHAHQPLVLVNYGCATGREILSLSNQIIASVKKKFAVLLEKEVNVL